MKLRFKVQPYQTEAVEAVADCFIGQPPPMPVSYRIDPGRDAQASFETEGFRNAEIAPSVDLLANIRAVQKRQHLHPSDTLVSSAAGPVNLDIEMETGTGKTYCYIKTMFELNKRHGWSKFIVMVPSVAIREGVKKSLEITAEHFTETYSRKARFFVYNSERLHELENFSSDSGINVMIINRDAFNRDFKETEKKTGKLRIFDERDSFGSRKPIDVIAANRPILIIDEPQKMQGPATQRALPKFNALFCLRYSATHKTRHNQVHRLDAVDAYREKLVKKIEVTGIRTKGIGGVSAHLYLSGIEVSRAAPVARLTFQVKSKGGAIRLQTRRIRKGDNLYDLSGNLDVYRGFVVTDVRATDSAIEFSNGLTLQDGEATGDVTEGDIRRIQIRETIRAHLDREAMLFDQGIKVLSLFFIDEVAKYRDYEQDDDKGEYAHVFEEEYAALVEEVLGELPLENDAYRKHLEGLHAAKTHQGYFSIDKKGKQIDGKIKARGEDAGLSEDTDAYDLILKDKERLLSFEEPTRFIFSHSALREGWDNPNVFVICTLKQSDNTVSRRQEVGRGLRIAVDNAGNRVDDPATVHDINVLTVVASESYSDFVDALQKETVETLGSRPRKATLDYFKGKELSTEDGPVIVDEAMATALQFHLIKNGYVDETSAITDAWHDARDAETLAPLPEALQPYASQIVELVNTVFSGADLPVPGNGSKVQTNALNEANFKKEEFQELWKRINRKAVYRVDFSSEELVTKCIAALNSGLNVTKLTYIVERGTQSGAITADTLKAGEGFDSTGTSQEQAKSARSPVTYDLLQNIGEAAQLTRGTVAQILKGIDASVFGQFKDNPERFIAEAARLIREQKAAMIVEKLTYDAITGCYDTDIFTVRGKQDFTHAVATPKKHIYDHVIADSGSKPEKDMAKALEDSAEVVVYAKLPKGFKIPTPIGDYNPDWAIAFDKASVKHIYFVAETKGSLQSLELRGTEKTKIECARKFFAELARHANDQPVRYDVVTTYDELMDIVSGVD